MENALRANPLEIREQYEKQLKDLQEAYGEAMLELRARKKAGRPHGAGERQLIRTLHEGLSADGIAVPLTKLCAWFGVPRRTVYYKPTKTAPKVDPRFAEPIKAMIEKEPSFGYRTVAWLSGLQQEHGSENLPDQALAGSQASDRHAATHRNGAIRGRLPNERWSTDLCRVWSGRDGWTTLALVIDCHTRELLGWHLSRSGKATTAASALEHALINRFGTLGKVPQEFLLRSDNGLVFTSRKYTALVRSYGLKQEFITPHCPQQNRMVERVIRTLKEQCVHHQRFDNIQHATCAIGEWIRLYNHRRPHQALDMKTPAEAFALAA